MVFDEIKGLTATKCPFANLTEKVRDAGSRVWRLEGWRNALGSREQVAQIEFLARMRVASHTDWRPITWQPDELKGTRRPKR